MKRSLVTLLIILAISFSLYSSDLESIYVGIGNDKKTYGISRNDDDQLSFSEHVEIESNDWLLNINYYGITNKGWRTTWSVDGRNQDSTTLGDYYSSRIDRLDIFFGLKLYPVKADGYELLVVPSFGGTLSGNLGQETIQNIIHKASGFYSVILPYDYPFAIHQYLGLTVKNNFLFNNLFEDSTLLLSLNGRAEIAQGLGAEESVNLALGLRRKESKREYLSLALGWSLKQSLGASSALELYYRFTNGPYLSINFDSGILRMRYYAMLNTTYGYGLIYVNALDLFKSPTWRETDLTLSYGISSSFRKQFYELELEGLRLGDFTFFFKNRFVTGPRSLSKNPNSELAQTRRERYQMGFYLLGARYGYSLSFTKDWIEPYIKASLGLAEWNYTYLFNSINSEEYTTPWRDEARHYAFVGDIELGLSIIPDGVFKLGSNSIRLSLYGGVTFMSNNNCIEEGEKEYLLGGFALLRYGFLLHFGFDA